MTPDRHDKVHWHKKYMINSQKYSIASEISDVDGKGFW